MTQQIESFEVTKGRKSGDLLSELRQEKNLKSVLQPMAILNTGGCMKVLEIR